MEGEYANFVAGGKNEFLPTYGEVNWRMVLLAKLAMEGQVAPIPVYFVTQDGLKQQITQENTEVYINRADDELDVITVLDPRDGLRYMFWRKDHEKFDEMLRITHASAKVQITLYPDEEIAETFMKLNKQDLEGCEFVPEDWEGLDRPE